MVEIEKIPKNPLTKQSYNGIIYVFYLGFLTHEKQIPQTT